MVQAYQVGETVHIRQELIRTPLRVSAVYAAEGVAQGPNSDGLAVLRFEVTAF